VSKETLVNALDLANALFQRFEDRGHHVTLAPEYLHRPALTVYEGQKFDYHNSEPWSPGRPTIVFIGKLPFGLTVYESTEHVDVTYEWNSAIRYVRASQASAKRRPAWADPAPTQKQHMPSGHLAVRAYSPHGRVTWEQRWKEATAGALMRKVATIVKEVEAVVPQLVQRRDEAEKEAAIERDRREAQWREHERQEQARRRAEARKASRHQLLAIVDDWSLARNIESFFEDAERRASALPAEALAATRERLSRARDVLGGTNALDRFHDWKSPDERE
jgi:hypothetical protein